VDEYRQKHAFFSDPVLSQLSDYAPYEELGQLLPVDFADRDILSKSQFLETLLFLSNYLLSSQGDRVAMAHSLEIRIPFLDFRVIDFAFKLPPRWRMFGLDEKYILKKSFEGFVPESIKLRAKQPYRAPIREVFFGKKRDDYVDEMLSEGYLKKVGLFNQGKVLSLVAKHRSAEDSQGSEVQNMAVAGILSTQLLYHQFIDDFPWKSIAPLSPDKVVRISQ
jgi:asparagine synthase (glutamine-hydrolysing)